MIHAKQIGWLESSQKITKNLKIIFWPKTNKLFPTAPQPVTMPNKLLWTISKPLLIDIHIHIQWSERIFFLEHEIQKCLLFSGLRLFPMHSGILHFNIMWLSVRYIITIRIITIITLVSLVKSGLTGMKSQVRERRNFGFFFRVSILEHHLVF